MSLLSLLFVEVDPRKVQLTTSYLYFISKQTGEPQTVIEFEDTLIVSGNQPGGPIYRFDTVDACLTHLAI